MNIEFFQMIVKILVCLAAAGLIMYRFRHYFQPFKKGDNLQDFIVRGQAERQRHDQAAKTMFGDPKKTLHARLVVFAGSILFLIAMHPKLGTVLWAWLYVVIGWFATAAVARNFRSDDWKLLTYSDRLTFRLYFVLLWPLFIWSQGGTSDKSSQ